MLLSNLEFGSYLSYTPRGKTDIAISSKNITYNLKNEKSIGNPPKFMSQLVAENIKKDIDKLPFKNFFHKRVHLVPVPKSSLIKANSLWVPELIAKALSRQEMGIFYPCLNRKIAIQKAAYSRSSDRPKAIDHFNSLECQKTNEAPEEILLIDDVITSGSALLGSASFLNKCFPNIPIKGFAVIRTISEPDNFIKILDSCVGTITYYGDLTYRIP